ncbi:MAG TPA: hypothetical protein VK075_02385 [Pseudogracilibacillus sp.]|nr:hypothetical protein [Pseudogracilibacillus sp.]
MFRLIRNLAIIVAIGFIVYGMQTRDIQSVIPYFFFAMAFIFLMTGAKMLQTQTRNGIIFLLMTLFMVIIGSFVFKM